MWSQNKEPDKEFGHKQENDTLSSMVKATDSWKEWKESWLG